MADAPQLSDYLADSPKNWGKWGPDDEVGSLNYLANPQVLAGVAEVRSGKTFTLAVPMGSPSGDPVWPGRSQARRVNTVDAGLWMAGKGFPIPGGAQYSDDMLVIDVQSSSQYDALGHAWYGDQLYNGYDAATTVGAMSKANIMPIAEKGIVGRGVLLDMAKYRGKKVLDPGETFTHKDLLVAAEAQGVEIRKRDILVIHTGWINSYYAGETAKFQGAGFMEPGLTHSKELVEWFAEMEIPNLVTDTIANEVTLDPASGLSLPLHQALMRNLGVVFAEIMNLTPLAEDCAADGQYSFLYTAAPIKLVNGTGAPVNPVVIK